MKQPVSNILIVENSSFIGNKIVNEIKDINGLENIYLTESLKEATLLLNKYSFNLIILDLKLKDGNGIEILKILKEKQMDIIVFVFSICMELNNTCLKYGATKFYDKANDFDKLIEDIKKLN